MIRPRASLDGVVWTGHAGGVEGGISDLSYLPEDGVGYALQINSANGDAISQIAKLVRGFLLRGHVKHAAPVAAAVSPVITRDFAGWYRPVSPRQAIIDGITRIFGLTHVTVDGPRVELTTAFGDAKAYLPVDSLRFRTEKGTVPTLAFFRDSANGRAAAMEGGDGSSYQRIGAASAVTALSLTALWLLAIVATVLAALWGAGRWVIRRVRPGTRGQTFPSTPAAPLWRLAMAAAAMLAIWVTSMLRGIERVASFGVVAPLSVAVYLAPIVFAVLVLIGVVMALRSRAADTRAQRMSLWLARSTVALHVVAVLYLLRHGQIGWRPWA